MQIKNSVTNYFDLRTLIVLTFSIAAYAVWYMDRLMMNCFSTLFFCFLSEFIKSMYREKSNSLVIGFSLNLSSPASDLLGMKMGATVYLVTEDVIIDEIVCYAI